MNIFSSMEKSFFQLIRGLNAIPVHLFIFLLLCGCFLSFVPNPNEEYYVGLTKVFADPQWIPGSFTFAESAGSRLFYNYLLYPLHSVFEFPLVVFLGRLIIITAITFPLSKLYAISKISNLGILLHLPFLYFAKQSYFAGSWIFLSLEPKCFAYVLVFWALYFLLKEKYKIAIFCLIGATYLHILVGGWCAIYFLVTIFFIKEIKHQQKLLLFILYFVSVLPFMFWLKFSVLTAPDTHPSADYIYSYFRSAHHTALAPTWRHFADIHFNGILHTFVVFVFTIFLYQEVNLSGTKKLTLFLLCTLFGSLVLVFVSFLDREGTFLKYYLYRINVIQDKCAIKISFFIHFVVLLLGKISSKQITTYQLNSIYIGSLYIYKYDLYQCSRQHELSKY